MLKTIRNLYCRLSGGRIDASTRISPEAVTWGYRLFLDREPDNPQVVNDALNLFSSTQNMRQAFMSSNEFRQNNGNLYVPSLSGNEPHMTIESAADLNELFLHIQKTWERFGESEPYWSVLTSDQFKSDRIEETRDEFYRSGSANVETLFTTLERNALDPSLLKTCLEYGCGLGRVTYWLSKKFERVWGYDISRSHLRTAEQRFAEKGVRNVSFHHISKPQDIANLPNVDLVYSIIVLQHNPPPIIRFTIQALMQALNRGGVAFFQVPTYRLGYRFSMKEYLADAVSKEEMEMHVLPQSVIFDIVRKERGQIIEVLEDGWTGMRQGDRSNTFVIQKI